jgi:tetratricopeptide (TPR) repeat protein
MKCPGCGATANGAFCAACGTPVAGARCRGCSAALPGGARFCTACGGSVRMAPNRLPWLITAGALVALIVVLLMPTLRPQPPVASFSQGAALPTAAAGFGAPAAPAGPLTGTVREQADRLFNRIMQARAEGNTDQVQFFLPMALSAYRQAEPLDDDGLFHLGLLEIEAGEAAAARATVERVLSRHPDHLLALAVAAEAAGAQGDSGTARAFYERLLRAYDAEHVRPLPEYVDHARVLPEYRAAAERFLQQ